jgi:dUTPase
VRRGARHGALDAVAEERLHAAHDDGRVPDAIKLCIAHGTFLQRHPRSRAAAHRTSATELDHGVIYGVASYMV